MNISVIKPGLETTIQDFPGRRGMLRHGVPPSGPQDDWSFRLANLVVGNPAGAAALECQLLGPELRFNADAVIAICGADMGATLDSQPVQMWQSIAVSPGQLLQLGGARYCARTYIAVAGGIDVPVTMGARATYATAALGGADGKPLTSQQVLAVGASALETPHRSRQVLPSATPAMPTDKVNTICVVRGPNDDWVSEKGVKEFFEAEWKLTTRSNRVGYRIQGPKLDYSETALTKSPEHGDHPSNIIDIGYPIGGINWAGETPIILMHDCVTLGGFFIPFTVPSCDLWKLAQIRPGSSFMFREITLEEAQSQRRKIEKCCVLANIVDSIG
ncbi:MAG: biotin-dependent carboxyltransferase [Rhizobiales bacterium]|nr:biotin-dependent carboxyltransferase [Hyphomicrobiales bacterium]